MSSIGVSKNETQKPEPTPDKKTNGIGRSAPAGMWPASISVRRSAPLAENMVAVSRMVPNRGTDMPLNRARTPSSVKGVEVH